jgi:hypothetical protein
MQEQALRVGEELVIEGHIRLTILAVEEGEVLLGLSADESDGVRGPAARQGRPRRVPVSGPSDN